MTVSPVRHRLGIAVTVGAALAICVATLTPVYTRQPPPTGACLVCGGRGWADAILNLVLFAPLGVGCWLAGLRVSRAVVLGALASMVVEGAQLIVPGRDPSLGDLVFNTAGTLIGCALPALVRWAAGAEDREADFLSVASALDVCLAVLLTGFLLQPVLPRTPYVGQWTPHLGHLEWYRGEVHAARVGSQPLPAWPLEASAVVRTALLRGDTIEVVGAAGPRVPGLASIVSIYDLDQREVLLVGVDRDELVLRLRRRAAAWRLDRPDIRVPSRLAALPPGAEFTIRAWSPEPGSYCVAEPAGETCELGFSVGEGWGLLLYLETLPPWTRRAFSFGWMMALLLPTGFLLRPRPASGIALVLVALALGWLPGLVELRPTPLLEWCGAALGLLLGAAAGGARALPTADGGSEDRVDERRECRSLRKDEQRPHRHHHHHDGEQPPLLAHLQELPELSDQASHTRPAVQN